LENRQIKDTQFQAEKLTMSAIHDAYFNILIANIPFLIAMLPILFLRKYMN